MHKRMRTVAVVLMLQALLISACGGGGSANNPLDCGSAFECRTAKSAPLAQRCEAPRSGSDPFNNNRPYPDQAGSLAIEQQWLRTYMGEVYLWPNEISPANPADYNLNNHSSPAAAMNGYFRDLLTDRRSRNNLPKDRFSFTADTAEWNARTRGTEAVGYGLLPVLVRAEHPNRDIRIGRVSADTPAAHAGLRRGNRIVAVDGVDVANSRDFETLNAGLFPSQAGEQHRFTVTELDGSNRRTVTLTAQALASDPVPETRVFDHNGSRIGYLLFTSHIATAEGALVNAITQFRDAGIDDLVLDLRYNGGGFLDIAAQLGYMIAGASATNGRSFETLVFNASNPLGDLDTRTPFHSRSQGFDASLAAGTALPSLNLPRVFVLSTAGTCSASESLINGLRGIDLQVIQVGTDTCGKPYGFFQQDNCGLSYFAIEFEGVNDKGNGGFTTGLAPNCPAADDFTRELGDPQERTLLVALQYQQSGQCSVSAAKAQNLPTTRVLRHPAEEVSLRQRPQ